jgi:hypothetical protein
MCVQPWWVSLLEVPPQCTHEWIVASAILGGRPYLRQLMLGASAATCDSAAAATVTPGPTHMPPEAATHPAAAAVTPGPT